MLCKVGSVQGINSEALALDTKPWLIKAASTITSLWTDGEMHTAMSDWGLELYVNGKKIAFFTAIRPSACIVEASLEWRTRICELSEQLAATLGVRFLEVSKHFVELVAQYQQLGVGGKKLVSLNGSNENILARHVRICLVDGTHEEVEQITFLEFDDVSNQFLFGHQTIEVSKIASITMPGDAPEVVKK